MCECVCARVCFTSAKVSDVTTRRDIESSAMLRFFFFNVIFVNRKTSMRSFTDPYAYNNNSISRTRNRGRKNGNCHIGNVKTNSDGKRIPKRKRKQRSGHAHRTHPRVEGG